MALLEARKGAITGGDEKVFPINQRNVRKAVAKTLEAGATPWSCHDLRRGFVSLAGVKTESTVKGPLCRCSQ